MGEFKIVAQSEELNAVEIYVMTKNSNITLVKDVEDGTEITVSKWLVYKDTNSKGEETTLLGFFDAEQKRAYATQSEAFRRSFDDIVKIFGTPVKIVKISGETKAGRVFQNCTISDSMIV